jgi:hypothetical protein
VTTCLNHPRSARPVRDVCSVDRFLLQAKRHSDELGKQMAELMSIDLAQAKNAPEFEKTMLGATNSARMVYCSLSSGHDAAKQGGCL